MDWIKKQHLKHPGFCENILLPPKSWGFWHMKMEPCPFHVRVMFWFHKKLPIDFFLENKIGSICLCFQLHIWLIVRIQGCTKMQLDFGKTNWRVANSVKHAKFPQTKEKQTTKHKQLCNYVYIYILYELAITTIVTLFCMIKTMQKGNDDRTCDKKPTFYENCNLSTGIMKLYTNQNNPSKCHPFASKTWFSPPKNKSPITWSL